MNDFNHTVMKLAYYCVLKRAKAGTKISLFFVSTDPALNLHKPGSNTSRVTSLAEAYIR
jgi:hypothetical protein